MSFLFGKSKNKNQTTALPPAVRDITSSGGEKSSAIPIANGFPISKDGAEKGRGALQSQTPTPGSSVNASLSSIQGVPSITGPEPRVLRERSDSDVHNVRNGPLGLPLRPPLDSPYPWAQRRLNFTTGANPFPRYGAAINSTASKEGWIYIMGGLINGSTVKGDLWMVEAGSGNMTCYPVTTTSEGPGPRVGHASLLVGNAFIVFGGDTKMDDGDVLDDTLYLLNTATKQWSRALPAGPRPAGRYGHTLNILGSKIYIFGGQVEGYFFNDLIAFDLNQLQAASNRWEVLIQTDSDGTSGQPIPAPRTNHSVVTWNDKLYLFGGTDGVRWFNDVWTYDPKTNAWTELDCIGYIPTPREGHAAALVNDTMYVFGGRVQEGTDLGDLAAFRISTRRWYMFQNMGPSPSPRSGHSMTAFGKHVVVLAGEPSASPRDPGELSLCYVLDTSKIRYPANDQPQAQQMPNGERAPVRKFSGGDRSAIPQSRGNAPAVREIATASGDPYVKGPEAGLVNGIPNPNSRLPRPGAASGPLPSQQPLQSRSNGVVQAQYTSRARTPPRSSDTSRGPSFERVGSPSANDVRSAQEPTARISPARDQVYDDQLTPNFQQPLESPSHDQLFDTIPSNVPPSRSGSRSTRQHTSLSSIEQLPSVDRQRSVSSREIESRPIDSGVGSSPALSQQNDDLLKELEAAKSRNAWYASELALARKSGYQTSASNSLVLDERGVDTFGEDDRPLLEALLKMRAELAKVQDSIDDRAVTAANRITEVEKQRDAAINEAVYARAKLAAQGGSQAGTPQPDSSRNMGTPDIDRVNDLNKRLASSLATQNELTSKLDALVAELDAERRARSMAEETAEAAQKRVSELDSYRQHNASEVESLRAELYEAQRIAREEAASSAEARSAHRLLEVDKNELATKHAKAVEHAKTHSTILQTLRDAVTASSDKASLLERRLDGEKHRRDSVEQRLAQLKLEHENRTVELETATRRLRETEELAEKHAAEANLHRQAVLSGLGKVADTDEDEHEAADQRVTILQQQVEAAHTMIRKYQTAADTASDKLRRAEERIAGLETYQEQTSRESLTIRKQLQSAMKEVQTLQTERAELQQQLERQQLESNAIEVQLKTLKNLLEERGISAADVRRSRGLDSPSLQTRFSTPEMTRVRDLEQQLEASIKAHDELRSTFEQREQAVSRDWEEKLAALENDHQAAVKYVRGIEKMLAKMKQELQRTKHTNLELEKELAQEKSAAATRTTEQEAAAEWEAERESLRAEITEMQESVKTSVSQLESQIQTLKSSLDASEREREVLQQSAMQTQQSHQRQREELEAATTQTRADLEHLRHENTLLEERARDAERKVQLFLDQFESSVDNYRRMSQMTPTPHSANGSVVGRGHRHTASGGSIYSTISDTTDATNSPTTNDQASDDEDGDATPNGLHHGFAAQAGLGALIGHSRDRSSIALDSLASELDALRSQWETTNKNYRMSDRLDFESTPTSEGGDVSESLASWRKRLDFDDEEKEGGKNDEGRSGEAGKEKVNGVSGSVGVIAGGNVSGEGGAA